MKRQFYSTKVKFLFMDYSPNENIEVPLLYFLASQNMIRSILTFWQDLQRSVWEKDPFNGWDALGNRISVDHL